MSRPVHMFARMVEPLGSRAVTEMACGVRGVTNWTVHDDEVTCKRCVSRRKPGVRRG